MGCPVSCDLVRQEMSSKNPTYSKNECSLRVTNYSMNVDGLTLKDYMFLKKCLLQFYYKTMTMWIFYQ